MPKQHTIELLRECVCGADMCISALNEMLKKTTDAPLKKAMQQCKDDHVTLYNRASNLLYTYGDHGKKPSPLAQSMAYMKTNVTLSVDHSAKSVSELAAKGCDTGIQTMVDYLKAYPEAEEEAKEIAEGLIQSERELAEQTQFYL